MADLTLDFGAVSIPAGTSATAIVYEDIDGDGDAENSDSISLSDGVTSYTASGFDDTSGNSYWIEFSFDSTIESAPVIGTDISLSSVQGSTDAFNIRANGTLYSIPVFDTGELAESWLRIRTPNGVKAIEVSQATETPIKVRHPTKGVYNVQTQ